MGSRKSNSTQQVQQQVQQQVEQKAEQKAEAVMGSTPVALESLPDFQAAMRRRIDAGPFQGNVVAAPAMVPTDPLMTEGWGTQETAIRGMAPTIGAATTDLGNYWAKVARGDFLDPNNNLALQGYLDTFNNESQEQFGQATRNFRNNAISSGAFDDTNFARQNTWMAEEFDKNTKDQIAEISYRNYLDEMARIGMADDELGQTLALSQMPGMGLEGVGTRRLGDSIRMAGEQQLIDQAALTNDAARWDSASSHEMDTWAQYFNTLNNPAFGTNTNSSGITNTNSNTNTNGTTTQTEKVSGGWQDLLGAGASIAGAVWGGPSMAALNAFNSMSNRARPTTGFTAPAAPAGWANFTPMVRS